MCGIEDRFVSEDLLTLYDRAARAAPTYQHLKSFEVRRRLHYEERAQRQEDAEVRTLLDLAAESGDAVEYAARVVDEDGAKPLIQASSLPALRSLARSRGLPLEVVLRHALRDDLRSIVVLPPVTEINP